MIAMNSEDPAILRYLLNKGAAIDAVDENEDTVLHHCATRDLRESAMTLLSYGANIDAKNKVLLSSCSIDANAVSDYSII